MLHPLWTMVDLVPDLVPYQQLPAMTLRQIVAMPSVLRWTYWNKSDEVQHTIVGTPSFVDTKPENLFMLDPSACGANLVLSNSNMTVTNGVNKKWNAVRASTCFSNGVHYWEVHIDKCISKNIFVGIMTSNGSTDNYVGSDRDGWGYLANKAIWHNKGKMCTYGELFREGDRIGVTLDMDCGTVSFNRNGKELGIGVVAVYLAKYTLYFRFTTLKIKLVLFQLDLQHRVVWREKNTTDFNASKSPVIRPNSYFLLLESYFKRCTKQISVTSNVVISRTI